MNGRVVVGLCLILASSVAAETLEVEGRVLQWVPQFWALHIEDKAGREVVIPITADDVVFSADGEQLTTPDFSEVGWVRATRSQSDEGELGPIEVRILAEPNTGRPDESPTPAPPSPAEISEEEEAVTQPNPSASPESSPESSSTPTPTQEETPAPTPDDSSVSEKAAPDSETEDQQGASTESSPGR